MTARIRLAVSATLLLATLGVLSLRSPGEAVPIRKPLDALPASVGDWRLAESTVLGTDVLDLLKVHDYAMRRYVDARGASIWLYIAYWDTQRKGAQVHSPRNCLPGAGWEPLEASRLTVALPEPYGSIVVNRYLVQKDDLQQLVFYWYHAQGQPVAGEVAARVAMLKNAFVHNRTDGALIRVSSPLWGTVGETERQLVEYVKRLHPILGQHLPA